MTLLPLWLLISHLVGDYLLQTRWQAAGKFGWTKQAIDLRVRHVVGYCAAFLPVASIYGATRGQRGDIWHGFYWNIVAFMVVLALAHFFTDAQRFRSTIGDYVGWRLASPKERADAYEEVIAVTLTMRPSIVKRPADDVDRKLALKPNPWPTIGLAIDQTLHLAQVTVLAAVFLT